MTLVRKMIDWVVKCKLFLNYYEHPTTVIFWSEVGQTWDGLGTKHFRGFNWRVGRFKHCSDVRYFSVALSVPVAHPRGHADSADQQREDRMLLF